MLLLLAAPLVLLLLPHDGSKGALNAGPGDWHCPPGSHRCMLCRLPVADLWPCADVPLQGVGSHAAHLLLRSGVGRLRLIDFDQVGE